MGEIDCRSPLFMDHNEVPYQLSMENWLATQSIEIHRYDRSNNMDLKLQLENYLSLPISCFSVTCGADGALDSLFAYHASEGRNFFLPWFSYSGFSHYAKKNRCAYSFYAPDELLGLLESASSQDVVVICNPGNPLGEVRLDLKEALARCRASVIVDEAYIEFFPEASVAPFTLGNKKLSVVRTFSKAFAAPSVRVGYIISHPDQNKKLASFLSPFPVSGISSSIATFLLRNFSYIDDNIQMAKRLTQQLLAEVRALGYTALPTSTYFFSMSFGEGDVARSVMEALAKRSVYVADFSSRGFLRVTTLAAKQNKVFLDCLRDLDRYHEFGHAIVR